MRVISVNISKEKGVPKKPVSGIRLIRGLGVEGDAHSGPGRRQVSLLAIESYRRFEEQKLDRVCLKHGSFGENIITEGIVLHTLPIGTRLSIGTAELEVSQIGKECHAGCSIAKTVGSCIMPREGVFGRVIKEGAVRKGDRITIS